MKIILFALLAITQVSFAQQNNYVVAPKRPDKVITVGGKDANIQGFTNQAIQLAVDALPEAGGIVKLEPGAFVMMGPVRLRSNVQLTGAGALTTLKRIDGFRSPFIEDAGFGELKVTVKDASGFAKGMSVQITNEDNRSCWNVSIAEITDIVGNVLYIDRRLVSDYDSDKNGMVTNAGSCLSVLDVNNVMISNLTIDGNKNNNDKLDGCNGGGIAIIKSKNVTVDNVHVKDFNGEGITWQITENVTVKNSEINGCTNIALHPGTGSPNTLIQGNNSHDNKIGLYICWRVRHSIVKGNKFHNNSDEGISTGHMDTDVLFEDNHVYENGADGVYIRNENEKNAPHRNVFVNNLVENNGTSGKGFGFNFNGYAEGIELKNNIIRDNKNGNQTAGIFVNKNFPSLTLDNNKISGHPKGNIIYAAKN